MRALIDVSIVGGPGSSPALVFHTVTTPDGESVSQHEFEIIIDALAAVIVDIQGSASLDERYAMSDRMKRSIKRLEALND